MDIVLRDKVLEKELKFRISDTETVVKKIKELGFEEIGDSNQEDTYFDTENEHLFKEGKALRIRNERGKWYLTFKSKALKRKPKIREEVTIELGKEQVNNMIEILRSLGYREVLKVIKKRKEFGKNGYRIAIDEIEGLGRFLEIEYEEKENLEKILNSLGLRIENAIEQTYPEMLKI